jgi:signal transduction histidine kinase
MSIGSWWRRLAGFDDHEHSLRRVALRLALQTIVLLLVMVIALEGIVYVTTQRTLLQSLESTLTAHAAQGDPSLCSAFHLHCAGGPPPRVFSGPRRGGAYRGPVVQPAPGTGQESQGSNPQVPAQLVNSDKENGPSEASAVYVDRRLRIRHGDGSLSGLVLSPADALRAIETGRQQCCSSHRYREEDYLVYTAPLLFKGRIIGAVQTVISEHQYLDTMHSLLNTLMVVTLLGLIISSGISLILVSRALQPIRAAMQRQRDFVADAAHELRTPLAIMRTVGELSMEEPSPEELHGTIEQMLAENKHLTRLVEDLSVLARADSNAISLNRGSVDVSSLVADTAAEIAPLAEAQGLTLETDVAPSIAGFGDVLRLRQLLLILLDNALKHTPAGGTVSVRLFRQGDRARLQVVDSGPGIDPADLPHIFDRFYRADRAREGEGSGLGLAIAAWIVQAHGGQIRADNAPGRGASLTVTLPIARHEAMAAAL